MRVELDKLRPGPGDVLVLRAMEPPGPDDRMGGVDDPYRIVQQWMVDNKVEGVLIAALGEEQDVRLLDAEEMAAAGWYRGPEGSRGVQRIAAERQRQVEVEGYTLDHDDRHTDGDLGVAAFCYLGHMTQELGRWPGPPPEWPWEEDSWKLSDDPLRNLERAGALIAAEIDRLERQAARDVSAS